MNYETQIVHQKYKMKLLGTYLFDNINIGLRPNARRSELIWKKMKKLTM